MYDGFFINQNGDFYRSLNEILSAIYNPITLLDRYTNLIKQIIYDKNSSLDRDYVDNYYHEIVVLANESAVVNDRYAPLECKKRVIRADKLVQYIRDIESQCSKNEISSEIDIRAFADGIISLEVKNEVVENNFYG